MEPIQWHKLQITQLAEIKSALNDLINLIIGSNNLIQDLNFTSVLNAELMSIQFALYTADFSNTIRIGKSLERIYLQWIQDFKAQLKK
jgi:hypothetical protein